MTPTYNLTPPKQLQSSLGIYRELVPGPLRIPTVVDAQVPFIKWRTTMHTIGPPHLPIPNQGSKILYLIQGWLTPQMQSQG